MIVGALLLWVAAPMAVGEEQEFGSGVYGKLFHDESGWKVWKIETKSGFVCKAVRGSNGQNVKPLGFMYELFGGEPRLEISNAKKWYIRGDGDGGSVDYRDQNDRFFKSSNSDRIDIFPDGTIINVKRKSWKRPEYQVGFILEIGTIDTSGLQKALTSLDRCWASN